MKPIILIVYYLQKVAEIIEKNNPLLLFHFIVIVIGNFFNI